MEKIYSKKDPSKLLHCIKRLKDIKEGREDLIDPENFIQCSALRFNKGITFRPHKHIWKLRSEEYIAQESWVVISGRVRCTFYDTDNIIIAEPILEAGDVSFTLEGGHNYHILENNTIVYEMKTGKYQGQLLDKKFI